MATLDQARCFSLIDRVTTALERLFRKGHFRSLQLGKKMREGRITHQVSWHHNRTYRFVIDMEANAVVFPALLPASMRPHLPREVHAFLRNVGCLDGDCGELRMFVRHGALTLSVTFPDEEYERCTEYLVRLAGRVLGEFSEHPSYGSYGVHALATHPAAAECA
jgi:hypothetical protein